MQCSAVQCGTVQCSATPMRCSSLSTFAFNFEESQMTHEDGLTAAMTSCCHSCFIATSLSSTPSITLSVLQCDSVTSVTVTPHSEHCVQSEHSSNSAFPYKTITAITITRHFLCTEKSVTQYSQYKYLQISLELCLCSPHVLWQWQCQWQACLLQPHLSIMLQYCCTADD